MVEGTILLDPDDDVLDLVKLAPSSRRRAAEGGRCVVTFTVAGEFGQKRCGGGGAQKSAT
jgi:hypothetical protein